MEKINNQIQNLRTPERRASRNPTSGKRQVVNGYAVLSILGKGSFGTVYKGEKDGQLYALKMISQTDVQKKRMQKYVDNQINIMKQLNSPYIVKLVEFFQTKTYLWLVLEYCSDGTLLNYMLVKQPNEEQSLKIFVDILRGFRSIHEKQYLHRDLKPDNIFFKNGVAKIADFGLAKPADMKTTYCGTSFYMAPQIFQRKPQTYQVDLWSMGVILFFMIFREYPFQSNINILLDIINNTKPKFKAEKVLKNQDMLQHASQDLLILFERIFVYDPDKRISFSELFNLQIFNQHLNKKQRLSMMDVYVNLNSPRNREESIDKKNINGYPILNEKDDDEDIEVIEKTIQVTDEKLKEYSQQFSNIEDRLGIPAVVGNQENNEASEISINNMIMKSIGDEKENHIKGPKMMFSTSFQMLNIQEDEPLDEENTITPVSGKINSASNIAQNGRTPEQTNLLQVQASGKKKKKKNQNEQDKNTQGDEYGKEGKQKQPRRSLVLLNIALEKNTKEGLNNMNFQEITSLYNYQVGRYLFLQQVLEQVTQIELSSSNRAIIGYFLVKALLFYAIKLEEGLLKQINIFNKEFFEEFLTSSQGIILKGKLEHDIRFWAIRFKIFYYAIDFKKEGKNEVLAQSITENVVEKDFEKELKVPYRTVLDLLFRTIFDLGTKSSNPIKNIKLQRVSLYILLGLLINSAFEKRNLLRLFPKYFEIEEIQPNQFNFGKFTNYINTLESNELTEQIQNIVFIAFGNQNYDKLNRNNSIFEKQLEPIKSKTPEDGGKKAKDQ